MSKIEQWLLWSFATNIVSGILLIAISVYVFCTFSSDITKFIFGVILTIGCISLILGINGAKVRKRLQEDRCHE